MSIRLPVDNGETGLFNILSSTVIQTIAIELWKSFSITQHSTAPTNSPPKSLKRPSNVAVPTSFNATLPRLSRNRLVVLASHSSTSALTSTGTISFNMSYKMARPSYVNKLPITSANTWSPSAEVATANASPSKSNACASQPNKPPTGMDVGNNPLFSLSAHETISYYISFGQLLHFENLKVWRLFNSDGRGFCSLSHTRSLSFLLCSASFCWLLVRGGWLC